jgi:hypothetical protein
VAGCRRRRGVCGPPTSLNEGRGDRRWAVTWLAVTWRCRCRWSSTMNVPSLGPCGR